MPNPTVLTDAVVWLGGYDMTGASNEITFNAARQEIPDNRFGDTVEGFYPGPLTVGADVNGFFDSTLDDPLTGQLQSPTAAWPLSISPDGAGLGEVSWDIRGYTFGYSVLEASWGQSLPFRLSNKPASGTTLDKGNVMVPKSTETSFPFNGTKIQLGALTATQQLIAVFHVFAKTGAFNAIVNSDADASAGGETTRSSVLLPAAPGFLVSTVSGAVTDTWWLAGLTSGGGTAITLGVVFSIVNI